MKIQNITAFHGERRKDITVEIFPFYFKNIIERKMKRWKVNQWEVDRKEKGRERAKLETWMMSTTPLVHLHCDSLQCFLHSKFDILVPEAVNEGVQQRQHKSVNY